ncbi:MAG: outer membrane protein assembly factor BamE [Rickettsiales bacterium]|jgi:outer membrane protein assembly factor BamE (lipoprotein component of BamABCDE complex)|nr:outer membrane protein assembly factor BamE [Rickettsiales bacterium]
MKKILLLLLLTSCITLEKGKIFDTNDIDKIDIGITTKENVVRTLGFPSFVSDFDKNKWVYYHYKMSKFLFTKPSFKEQKVLVVDFDKGGEYVKNMTFYDIDTEEYEIVNNKTSLNSSDDSVIKDIFSNIGQVRGQ